jgi:hypothetical protein
LNLDDLFDQKKIKGKKERKKKHQKIGGKKRRKKSNFKI